MLASKAWAVLSTPLFLGCLSLLLTVAAYVWYLRDTFKKGVRPHILTWLAFGGFTTVGWLVQVKQGAGPADWAMGVTSACCFIISGASVWKQRQEDKLWWKFRLKDWMWVVLALVVFGIYLKFPIPPAIAAISATVADLLSYGPTINQGLRDPYRDSRPAFLLNGLKFIPTLLALYILRAFSLATAFYPAAILVMNIFVFFLLGSGRRQIEIAQRAVPKAAPFEKQATDSRFRIS